MVPFKNLMVGEERKLKVMVIKAFMNGLANSLILQFRIDLMENGPKTFQLLFILRQDAVGVFLLTLGFHG